MSPYTAAHEDFRATVRQFVEREIAPHVNDWDEAAERGERLPSEAALFQIGRVLDIPISVERSMAPGSDRREKVLVAIRGYVKMHYAPPPIRWLCNKTGISSTSLMRYYILGLIREGRLVRTAQGAHTYWYTLPELIEAVKAIDWK